MIESKTDGLVSGYQRTNVTTSGAQMVASTGGYVYVGIIVSPYYAPVVLEKSEIEKRYKFGKEDGLEAGYREMSLENQLLAEELFAADLEEWPCWETNLL